MRAKLSRAAVPNVKSAPHRPPRDPPRREKRADARAERYCAKQGQTRSELGFLWCLTPFSDVFVIVHSLECGHKLKPNNTSRAPKQSVWSRLPGHLRGEDSSSIAAWASIDTLSTWNSGGNVKPVSSIVDVVLYNIDYYFEQRYSCFR